MTDMLEKYLITAIAVSMSVAAEVAHAATSAQIGQWGAAMGQSGLRRFYSTGSDLGELVNRQLSYQLAIRTGTSESEVDSYVLQWDTLYPVDPGLERPFFVRGLARSAKRFEPDKVHGRNDRFDLGVLYAPTGRSYIGVGLAYEHTDADIKFVPGNTDGNAFGQRIDAGLVMTDTLALGVRLEELRFDGNNRVTLPTPGGPLTIDRDIETERRFFKSALLARYTREQFGAIPAGVQLGWMAGVQYLDTRYEPKINSLGQPVSEPFGNRERLGIVRAGVYSAVTFGENDNWNASLELMADNEFDTNMDAAIDSGTTGYLRAGLAYIAGPGKRIQFDYQGFRSSGGARERHNFAVIAVMDF